MYSQGQQGSLQKKRDEQNCCVSFIINYCFLTFTMQLPSFFRTKKVPNLGETSIIGIVQPAYALATQTQRERTGVYKRGLAMF